MRDGGLAVWGMEHRKQGKDYELCEIWGYDESVRVPLTLWYVHVHLLCFYI